MAIKSELQIDNLPNQPVQSVTANASGWAGMPNPPGNPDWASAEIVAQIGGKAYRIGADAAPGAFAAMATILINAAQNGGLVNIWFYQPSTASTPVLLSVQMVSG